MQRSIHKQGVHHALNSNCLRDDPKSMSAAKYPPEHSNDKAFAAKNQTTMATLTKPTRPKRKRSFKHTQAQRRNEHLQQKQREVGCRSAAAKPSGRKLNFVDANNASRHTRIRLSSAACPRRTEFRRRLQKGRWCSCVTPTSPDQPGRFSRPETVCPQA